MDNFYIACDLGAESGRVMLGSLHKNTLTLSEIRRFQNQPIQEKDSLRWNIPQLYHETLAGLRSIGAHDEPVDSVSCNSWAADYMLFEADGIRFQYPSNWQVARDDAESGWTVTVQSPGTAFFLLTRKND